ncbi:nitroreductase family protein [Dethiobacter alkaliphilus]|uniref:Nitroreductase n=1 Tax=Dethiobacter alkaliphilus AHT 1 TaxID=555088 RepID=C0GCP6_DETAL|nr:nitroreductase family protein [Dethiobacter alkaliphilus]EEG78981.1 nitroreductase [Dethiobacter alkaliphilus AHT 1]
MDTILRRRSIRKYKDKPVPEQVVYELLRAGMNAPSAGNAQPWHFVVIRDRKILDAVPEFHPYSGMIREAPMAILVCGDLREEKYPGYWVQDCSAATQNILLAAQDRGLGTVWLGMYPREERVLAMRKLLGMPEEVIPLSLIPVGYPAEKKGPADRFLPERVHYDGWNKSG